MPNKPAERLTIHKLGFQLQKRLQIKKGYIVTALFVGLRQPIARQRSLI